MNSSIIIHNQKLMHDPCMQGNIWCSKLIQLIIVISPIIGVQSYVNLMDDYHQKSLTSQFHFYKTDVLFQGSHDGMIVVTYVVFLNSLVFRYVCNCMALLIVALIAACVE